MVRLLLPALLAAATAFAQPLRLYPENPHYFLFGGRPTVLVTSGEHYGAVLNQEFDYARYLDSTPKRPPESDACLLGIVSRGGGKLRDIRAIRWRRRRVSSLRLGYRSTANSI